jgi:hypothetical protein
VLDAVIPLFIHRLQFNSLRGSDPFRLDEVPGEFFFLTFGGLGISLAGFAGLIYLLDPSQNTNNAISRWRIRHIALSGLLIATTGLLVFPVYFLTDDVPLTVRLISLFGLLSLAMSSRRDLRPGPAWPDDGRRKVNMILAAASGALWVACIVTASVGLLMLTFVGWISAPIGTFANSILELEDAPSD